VKQYQEEENSWKFSKVNVPFGIYYKMPENKLNFMWFDKPSFYEQCDCPFCLSHSI
jgi:hypothetical protein